MIRLSVLFMLIILSKACVGIEKKYDVIVYGGTPGGITAAISAAREGSSVILLEQTKHVGGLSTSGLNRDEGNHMLQSTFGGLSEVFIKEAATRSGTTPANRARTWQSNKAEEVFVDMLREAKVTVKYEQLLNDVHKDGSKIISISMQNGANYHAQVFIDATYEGDLMAKSGVSYTVGFEARET